jgi:hypothetical protein
MVETVQGLANYVGIHVATYSPGDGVTRYRFFHVKTDFAGGFGIYTALGRKEAMAWLRGYQSGRYDGAVGMAARVS